MRIHLIAAVLVLAAAWNLQVTAWRWGLLLATIIFVIVTEMLNTAVEYTVDLFSPDYSDLARAAKDIAAGAVLFSALGAVAVANLVFAPYLSGLIPWLWQQATSIPAAVSWSAAAVGLWLLWSERPVRLLISVVALFMQLWLLHRFPDIRVASALVVVSFLACVSGREARPVRFYMGVLLMAVALSRLITLGG